MSPAGYLIAEVRSHQDQRHPTSTSSATEEDLTEHGFISVCPSSWLSRGGSG